MGATSSYLSVTRMGTSLLQTYLLHHLDAKGNIPAWILTIKAKEQPQGLLTLKTLITEEAEAEPGGVDAYCERFDFPYEGL